MYLLQQQQVKATREEVEISKEKQQNIQNNSSKTIYISRECKYGLVNRTGDHKKITQRYSKSYSQVLLDPQKAFLVHCGVNTKPERLGRMLITIFEIVQQRGVNLYIQISAKLNQIPRVSLQTKLDIVSGCIFPSESFADDPKSFAMSQTTLGYVETSNKDFLFS